ncbi:MAG: hypothetical protein QOD65_4108 [Gaiellales bacterium]|nr:hypothetical protein [Gaiellales bacterium]
MITQSVLYNAIIFTYAIVLTKFYGVDATLVPIYGVMFSVGNLVGPILLRHLFDTWGRKKMIAGTYILSGVLLAVSAWLFEDGRLDAETQTILRWSRDAVRRIQVRNGPRSCLHGQRPLWIPRCRKISMGVYLQRFWCQAQGAS